MPKQRFARVLVKVSGEALMGSREFGLDPKTLERIGKDLAKARKAGAEIAVVVGGGNILRGARPSGQQSRKSQSRSHHPSHRGRRL